MRVSLFARRQSLPLPLPRQISPMRPCLVLDSHVLFYDDVPGLDIAPKPRRWWVKNGVGGPCRWPPYLDTTFQGRSTKSGLESVS